jgi:hypothetical protein
LLTNPQLIYLLSTNALELTNERTKED